MTSVLKKDLRKAMKTLLQSVDKEDIESQSRVLIEKLASSPRFQESKRVSIFVSTSGEICTDDLIRKAFLANKQVFVPQFAKGNPLMRMVHLPTVETFESLPCTLWNIRQPALDKNWEDYFLSGPLDLVIAPGLAFTRSGQRLGHGMGYYDRWFVEHEKQFGKRPYVIGIALKQQILDSVPTTYNDVTIDEVLTV